MERTDGAKTAREGRRRWISREDLITYGWVLAVTAFILEIVFASRQLYPLGPNTLVYTDGTQYFGMLGYLQSTFYTDNDLLFSWSTVLGGNNIGMWAFGSASPFNLLTVFFPGNLLLALHVIFWVKFLAAALCFAILVRSVFPTAGRWTTVLFAASYPFIGYMTYFAWNQSWMDAVVFLPLIVLGIWKLIQCRKPLLYIISLAVVLFSNYYIGYMVAIGTVLLFIAGCVIAYRSFSRDVLWAIAWYAVSSLAAAGLAAVVLIPVYSALPPDRSIPFQELMDGMQYLVRPSQLLSMLYTAPYENMDFSNNYPVIFTGIVQLVLVVLFFLNRRIAPRLKAAAGGLLLAFAISFSFSAVNSIWHGFTSNVWYNYRYSFLCSFVLELIALYSFLRINNARKRILAAAAVIALITALVLAPDANNVQPTRMLFDLICVFAALILLRLYADPEKHDTADKKRVVVFVLIAALAFGSLSRNAYLTLDGMGDPFVARDGLGDVADYETAQNTERTIQELIGEDDGFYRRAAATRFSSTDPMLYAYAGVENYASSENLEALETADRLGILQDWKWARYDENVPIASDALLGIRYIAVQDEHKAAYLPVLGYAEESSLTVLEDPYALPLLFPIQTTFDSDGAQLNDIEYITACWNSIDAAGGDVFGRIESQLEFGVDGGSDVIVHFIPTQDGPVYAYVPKGAVTPEVPLAPGGGGEEADMFYVGDFNAGDAGELMIRTGGDYDGWDSIALYTENIEAIAQKAAAVQSRSPQIDRLSSSHLKLQCDWDQPTIVGSTILVDDGWRVSVDGRPVDTLRTMDVFIAFEVPGGTHEVELVYSPPKLLEGLTITLITAAVLVLLWYLQRKRPTLLPGSKQVCLPDAAHPTDKKDSGDGAKHPANVKSKQATIGQHENVRRAPKKKS